MSEPTLPVEVFGRLSVPGTLERTRKVLLPDTKENQNLVAAKLTKLMGLLLGLHWVLAFVSFGVTAAGFFVFPDASFFTLIPFFALFPHQFFFIIGSNLKMQKKLAQSRYESVQKFLDVFGMALSEMREEDIAVDLALPLKLSVSRADDGAPVLYGEPTNYGLTPEGEEIMVTDPQFTSSGEIPAAWSIPLTREQCALDLSVDPDDDTRVNMELRDKEDRERFCVKVAPESLNLSPTQVQSLPRLVRPGITLPAADEVKLVASLMYVLDAQGVFVPDVVRRSISAEVVAS